MISKQTSTHDQGVITVLCWWHIFGRVDTVIFFSLRYFLDKVCFSICGANPAGTDVCVGYLANATESTCGLSDTRQSQLEQIQAIMVHFIGYILYPEAAVGCRFAVLVCSMIFFKASCPSRPPQTCHCSSACGC